MSSIFVAVAYGDMYQAQKVRLRLLRMQKEYSIDLENAVVAARDDQGKVKLRQIHDMTAAGALSGSFWERPLPQPLSHTQERGAHDYP